MRRRNAPWLTLPREHVGGYHIVPPVLTGGIEGGKPRMAQRSTATRPVKMEMLRGRAQITPDGKQASPHLDGGIEGRNQRTPNEQIVAAYETVRLRGNTEP